MDSGVYLIENLKNRRVYVGSGVSISNRWSVHRSELKHGRHYNQHLQAAWRKYGPDSFRFSVLELCPVSELAVREQFWIDVHNAVVKGYNIQPQARSSLGAIWSEASRHKASQSAKRTASTAEQRQMRSERAKRQHAEGRLGRRTWSVEAEASCAIKQARLDRSKQVAALKDQSSDPAKRAARTAKLKVWCQAHPEEMARRAKARATYKPETEF